MTTTEKAKTIKAALGFDRLTDNDLLKRLDAIYAGMTGSSFHNAPVGMAVFRSAIDAYHTLTTDALDGGKKAISAKRKQRAVVIKIATQLAHYVEATCDNDLATFITSGFVPASQTRTPPQPLPPAGFDWIDRAPISGQVLVRVVTIPGALVYEVRCGVDGNPSGWPTTTLTSPKTATIKNLTPGATYQFQVRALGKLGYTDWSDSTTFISG